MSTVDLTNHSGNQALAQWERPSDYAACSRCGITRRIHPGRSSKNLCRDCWVVENETARIEPAAIEGGTWNYRAGVWRWVPDPERLSAEDRAWCEQAANAGFWAQWEKANRGRSNPLQAEAMRRAARLWTAMPEFFTPIPADSGAGVDKKLPNSAERMFDSNNQVEGAA
jgi:hypothetical protein